MNYLRLVYIPSRQHIANYYAFHARSNKFHNYRLLSIYHPQQIETHIVPVVYQPKHQIYQHRYPIADTIRSIPN